ncbi:MAG TPA: zinc ribbon domain-containing protein [Candidatus Binatia bacterium]|jgi:putative FmdB family regulatory protein|nr:zinc ribbon domain-containing protein [Candidatus Binatia bacterium]
MPIYEYRCEHCGDFEQNQRISDPPLSKCPKCRRKVRKLISSTSFQLKGSGWYVTDYGRSGSNGGAKDKDKGGSDSSSSESKSEAKSESKSETKSETKSESKPEKKAAAAKSSD